MRRNGYLKEAAEIVRYARGELKETKEKNSFLRSRQVCEKGYLALLRILDGFLLQKGIKEEEFPKTERGRRFYLGKYATKEFRTKYTSLRHDLHIDGFHEGILEPKEIKESLKDLRELIKKVSTGRA